MMTTETEPWPLDAEQRQLVVSTVMHVMTTSTDPREQLAAARVILSMDQQNMQWSHKRDTQLRQAIYRLAAERGIKLA